MNNKNRIKILLAISAVVAAGVVYTLVSASGKERSITVISDETQVLETAEDKGIVSDTGYIIQETAEVRLCVHVCGAVEDPGVYYLPEGSRVHQAVEMAGGFTRDADESVINLASYISDGMQIYVPDTEEASREGLRPAAQEKGESSDARVNINTADAAELMTLPGIGQSKAEQIIAYRNENGSFKSAEDIKNVSGIGESSFNKLKDLIKV